MRSYAAIGRVGGPGTFWEGFEYDIGTYPFEWMAEVAARMHLWFFPCRLARIEKR